MNRKVVYKSEYVNASFRQAVEIVKIKKAQTGVKITDDEIAISLGISPNEFCDYISDKEIASQKLIDILLSPYNVRIKSCEIIVEYKQKFGEGSPT